MNRTALRSLIIKHEGLKGDANASEAEALARLDDAILPLILQLNARIACFGSLDTVRQHVLVDIAFNIGVEQLLHFTKMLTAIEEHNFEAAAEDLLSSVWAKKVGKRADELAAMLRGER